MNENPQVIIEFVPDASKLDASLQNTMTELQATGKIGAEVAAQFSTAQNGVTESINKTNQATQNLGDSYKQINANIAGGALKEAGVQMNDFATSTGRVTTQIRSMTNELIKMRLAGKEGTTEFLNLQNATSKLQREAIIARGTVRALAEEFQGFRAAAEAIHGVNAAMQIGTGIAATFGTENEKVEKEIQSLAGVMLIANGLQEAATLLQEKSQLRLEAQAIWTEIVTAATEQFAAVSARAWLVATAGVGALVIGIIKLVQYFNDLNNDALNYKEHIDSLNDSLEMYEAHIKFITSINKTIGFNNIINELDGALKAAQIANEALDSFYKGLEEKMKNTGKIFSQFDLERHGKMSSSYLNMTKEDKELWEKLNKQSEEASVNLIQKEGEREKQQIEISKKGKEDRIKADKDGFNKQLALFDEQTLQIRIAYVNQNSQLQGFQKGLDALNAERGKERTQLIIKNDIAVLEERKRNAQTLGDDIFNIQEKIFDKQRDLAGKDVDAQKKISNERLEFEVAYLKEREKANLDTATKIQQESNAIRAKGFEDAKAIADANLELQIKNTQAELDAKKKALIAENKLQVNALRTTEKYEGQNSAEILKANDELIKKLQDADTAYKESVIASHKEHSAQVVGLAQATQGAVNADPFASDGAKRAAAKATLQAQHNDLVQQMKDNNDQYDIDVKNAGDSEEAKAKLSEKYELQQKTVAENIVKNHNEQMEIDVKEAQNVAAQAVGFAKQASDAIFKIENDARNQKYDLEIAAIQRTSDFELNNDKLTFAQKAAIKKKFDKEAAAIKLQQWNADKEAKETQAIINTALAVVSALATAPTIIAGIALAAAAAAAGAVEIATIASTKPPAFALGTPKGSPNTPAGMKLVGEHGPELITTGGGERIVPSAETAKILADYAIPSMPSIDGSSIAISELNANAGIDYDKLGKVIAEKLKGVTQAHVSIDKNGIQTLIVKGGSKHTFNNNKFSA